MVQVDHEKFLIRYIGRDWMHPCADLTLQPLLALLDKIMFSFGVEYQMFNLSN
jgi:hypothetical protein